MEGNSRMPVNHKQLGVSGLRHYGAYVYEEFLPDLRWPQAGRVYQEMSDNDPVIGAILYLAEMLIRGAGWEVEPGGDSEEDKEAAEFVRGCMDDMDSSWADTICEILSMLTYGFSFHEIVYKVRRGPYESNPKYRSKFSDGKIGWRRLPIRSQSSLAGWVFNDDDDVIGVIQRPETSGKEYVIPMSKGLLFRTRISRGNPEGKSLLRNAYRPWYFKKHFEEIEGIGIERDLAGFPVLQAPEGLDLWNEEDERMVKLRANAEALVASIRRDSEEGVLLPPGWDLKLLASGSSRQINIGETIERYDNRIAITMLSDIILIGNNKAGSFALADTKQSMLAAALQAQLSNIADVFNAKAVPDLLKCNGFAELDKLPRIVPGRIQSPTLKELALILRSMNLDVTSDVELQNFVRHLVGAPLVTEEDIEDMKSSAEGDNNAPVNNKATGGRKQDDSVDNAFEQSDGAYTGQ